MNVTENQYEHKNERKIQVGVEGIALCAHPLVCLRKINETLREQSQRTQRPQYPIYLATMFSKFLRHVQGRKGSFINYVRVRKGEGGLKNLYMTLSRGKGIKAILT